MPFDVVSYVLARKALAAAKAAKGLRFIADVEANASVLTIEGFDKTKTYLLHVIVHNVETNAHWIHVRVNGDSGTNYRFQYERVSDNTTSLYNYDYGEVDRGVIGDVPASSTMHVTVYVSPEWFDKSTSRYTISFHCIGGGPGPTLFTGHADYGISDPIPSPYSLTIGSVYGYFDYVRVVVYEVVG